MLEIMYTIPSQHDIRSASSPGRWSRNRTQPITVFKKAG